MVLDPKETIYELKAQWKSLWNEKVDDRVRAEGIAKTDYSMLFVEKGTVIYATRDFKALSFRKILELNQIENPEKFIPANPEIGGWTKFIKNNVLDQKPKRRDLLHPRRVVNIKSNPKVCLIIDRYDGSEP